MNFEFNDPDYAYSTLMNYVKTCGTPMDSRNGQVLSVPSPVLVTFQRPNHRVLFNKERRANPFFHLAEALWMLSGRNDTNYVTKFNRNMENFSDNGTTFNAAYGHRWRNHFRYDQIKAAVEMLRRNPDDRRVVISMWDPTKDLGTESKDIPCNTQLMFRVTGGALSMTSVNRSNDLVWGLMGANCVHLSILHEFMARATGNKLGAWHHMTNNLHVYERHWGLGAQYEGTTVDEPPLALFYESDRWPMFLSEVERFVEGGWGGIHFPFLRHVAIPMQLTWEAHKAGHLDLAKDNALAIQCPHWRTAAQNWLEGAV
jgi:thymidylate synthase